MLDGKWWYHLVSWPLQGNGILSSFRSNILFFCFLFTWNINFIFRHLQCSSGKRAWKRKLQSCKILYTCVGAYILSHWIRSLLILLIFKGKTCLRIYHKWRGGRCCWGLVTFVGSRHSSQQCPTGTLRYFSSSFAKQFCFTSPNTTKIQNWILKMFHLNMYILDTKNVLEVLRRLIMLIDKVYFLTKFEMIWTGVAIGAGWQSIVAYVNIGCYYVIGIPVGLVLGEVLHLEVKVGILLILMLHLIHVSSL